MNRDEKNRIRILADGVVQQGRRRLMRSVQLPFPYGPPPVPDSVELPETESDLGEHFDTDWARTPLASAARAVYVDGVLRPTVSVLASPRRMNEDRLDPLRPGEPAVFVANHLSHIDTPLLLTSIPVEWRRKMAVGAAADYFFMNRMKGSWSALSINAVPMERTRTTRTSIARARELLEDGWSILLFPEGGRSPDGWGQDFKNGAAYIAQSASVPVVPMYITGTDTILAKGRTLPKPAQASVNFGAPLRADDEESTRRFAGRIEHAVGVLADETATDWWQAKKNEHANTVPSLTGPEAASWRRQWTLGERKAARKPKRKWPYV